MNFLQTLEQYSAMLRDLTPVLKQYKDDLIKQGFTENQAFRMTVELQKTLTSVNKEEK